MEFSLKIEEVLPFVRSSDASEASDVLLPSALAFVLCRICLIAPGVSMGLVGGGDDFGAVEMCAEVPLEARTTGVLGDVTTRVASATFGLNSELLWALPLPVA